jgi:hypothetical protein
MFRKGESIFDKVTLMLLGPSIKIDLRREISLRLHDKYGYPSDNIIIMEDVDKDETLIISKFGNILNEYAPQLFFALFESSRDIDMSGVIFELGWLCGTYNILETSKRVRIIADFDYRWRKTTRYIQSLTHNAQLLPVDNMNVELISDSIHNNIKISLNSFGQL